MLGVMASGTDKKQIGQKTQNLWENSTDKTGKNEPDLKQ